MGRLSIPGALLASVPFLALQVDRGVRALLRGHGGVPLVVVLLVAGAGVPLAIEGSRQQPISETVDGLRDGVSSLSSWVRMRGRIVTLTSPQNVAAGQHVQSLLIEGSGDAILLSSDRPLDDLDEVTGRIANSARADEVARSVGGPRMPDQELDIIDRYLLTVDDPIVPQQDRDWTLVWLMLGTAGALAVGRAVGYPVLRIGPRPVPAAARPLAIGESLAVRAMEPENETGLRLVAPRARLERLRRDRDDDPYFALRVAGRDRPLLFRRHRWSTAAAGRLWALAETAPVVELRDWGIEVLLVPDRGADQDRVLASFLADEEPAVNRATHASAV